MQVSESSDLTDRLDTPKPIKHGWTRSKYEYAAVWDGSEHPGELPNHCCWAAKCHLYPCFSKAKIHGARKLVLPGGHHSQPSLFLHDFSSLHQLTQYKPPPPSKAFCNPPEWQLLLLEPCPSWRGASPRSQEQKVLQLVNQPKTVWPGCRLWFMSLNKPDNPNHPLLLRTARNRSTDGQVQGMPPWPSCTRSRWALWLLIPQMLPATISKTHS